jgi:hypothetical protein
MQIFDLKGRIISKVQLPMEKLNVEAFDEDPILKPDDLLGESETNTKGTFAIQFDKSKFDDFWESFEGTPDVFLKIKDNQRKELIRTRTSKTRREIQYHIRVDPIMPNPDAPDIYSGNARRMLNMLAEVGELIGVEYRINLDLLNNGNLDDEVKGGITEFVEGHQDRRYNFDQLIVIFSSLIDSLAEETRVGNIGYDGPQVPRFPRRVSYHQVIIWPRQEGFVWA